MISVIIPLYNKADTVSRALNSVICQTYKDYEIIVVDDGSTDNGVSVVEKMHVPDLRIVCQANAGVAAARNCGIAEAKGEFVAFLDADDEWKSDYLKIQMSLVSKYPDCDVFACNYEHISEKGVITPTIIQKLPFTEEDGVLSNYFEVASCSHPPICSISIMVRKTAMESIGGFPNGIKSGEDLLTWARLAAICKIAYSKNAQAVYHVGNFDVCQKPKRIPVDDDIVGKELEIIARRYHPAFINRYISHWHKMRCVMFMQLGMRKKSVYEAFYGLKFYLGNYKLYIYIVLNYIPQWINPFKQ